MSKSIHVLFLHPMIRPQEGAQHAPYGILELMAITDQLGYKVGLVDNNAAQLPIDGLREEIRGNPQAKTFNFKNLAVTVAPNGNFQIKTQEFLNNKNDFDAEAFAKQLAEETKRLCNYEIHWDIIGIGGLITQTKYIEPMAKMCKEEFPESLLVAGGGFLSSMPFDIMKWIPSFDIGVIGEAYKTWPEILEEYQGAKDWSRVKGLVYREGKKVKLSGMRPLITEEEMDDVIPWPHYGNMAPMEVYLRHSAMPYSPESSGLMPLNLQEPLRRLDARASLGCSWNCLFCTHVCGSPSQQAKLYSKKVTGKPFRHNSPKYVVGLMADLRRRYSVNFVSFIDENFTTDRQWFLDFCQELEDQDIAGLMNWGVVGHSRTVDQQMLQKGRDVGMRYISFGGESGSQKILNSLGKGQTPQQMTAAIDACRATKITPIMSFIVGFPDETIDDIIETCQFFIDNGITCDPFFLTSYPSTAYYDQNKDWIVSQHLTADEKSFFDSIVLANKQGAQYLDTMALTRIFTGWMDYELTPSAVMKRADEIRSIINDAALHRWVLSLDDATKLSCNISQFTDVELAGLKYMLFHQEIDRLKEFKKQKESVVISGEIVE